MGQAATTVEFEAVIGLEVHAHLLTKSKIFCGCSTRFGAPPNSSTCPVCLGLPGALPVLNRQAVAMAVRAGLALGCRINRNSLFARKNYFYPDLPKGYQISQYDRPVAEAGRMEVISGVQSPGEEDVRYLKKTFGITRVHLEEDAGKSVHRPGGDSYVDLNRTGVPLIEIVSEPDFSTSREAYDYLSSLRRTLLYLGVCDGNMEQGSLRCDANVSVRPVGAKTLGTKTEIKNLNSFRFLQKALDFEIDRQVGLLRSGQTVDQETRLWDEARERTIVMRSKEEAHDYRYFAEPDLLPVVVAESWLEELKGTIPELPEVRRERLVLECGLGHEEALFLTQTRPFADFFEEAVAVYPEAKAISNWMMGELTRYLNRDNLEIQNSSLRPGQLAELVRSIDAGEISGKIAKQVFEKVYETGEDPGAVIVREGFRQISDEGELEGIVAGIIEANPEKVDAYRAGKTGLMGFFVGEAMKKTRGQADPKVVNQMLRSRLELD